MKNFSLFRVLTLMTGLVIAILFTSCQKDESLVTPSATLSTRSTPPEVPDSLEVPAGNKVSLHRYAEGVQIYVCKQTSPGVFAWVFKAPDATLYANAGYNGVVGTHYAGPTWESNSGSKVVGVKLKGATLDPTAIPWLLLGATSSQGPGPFAGTTFIQRVNTTAGLAPTLPANAGNLGQEIGVPYTAEYYFYKAE